MHTKLIGFEKFIRHFNELESLELPNLPDNTSIIAKEIFSYVKSVNHSFIMPVSYLSIFNKIGLERLHKPNFDHVKQYFEEYFSVRAIIPYSVTYEGFIGDTYVRVDLYPVDRTNQYYLTYHKSFFKVTKDNNGEQHYNLYRKNKPALIEYNKNNATINYLAYGDGLQTKSYINSSFDRISNNILLKYSFDPLSKSYINASLDRIHNNKFLKYSFDPLSQNLQLKSIEYDKNKKVLNIFFILGNKELSFQDILTVLPYKKNEVIKYNSLLTDLLTEVEIRLIEMNYL